MKKRGQNLIKTLIKFINTTFLWQKFDVLPDNRLEFLAKATINRIGSKLGKFRLV
jgi:hypothetical protein